VQRLILIIGAMGLLGIAQISGANGSPGHHPGHKSEKIDVMTMNQYLGADLTPIVTAPDLPTFNDAVVEALESIAANDFPARADALARLIARRSPELVGLQEVFSFECRDLAQPTPDQGCDNPRIRNAFNDHLALTLDALEDRHRVYEDVATVVNIDTTGLVIPPLPIPGVPFTIDGYPAVVNFFDRDVILVRGDIAGDAAPVDYTLFQPLGICSRPSADGCNYQVVATAGLPDGTVIAIERGFVGVDVKIDGRDYRFVDTHLEVQEPEDGNPLSSVIQAAQSQELLGTLANTTPLTHTLVVVGDINSSPEDEPIVVPPPLPPGFPPVIIPPYIQFVGSGYTDAWTLRPGNRPGDTCCQDKDLLNHKSELDERIDVIFSLDVPVRVKKARVLGNRVSGKPRPPGERLWPSDHGSVAAELQF
jgi:hypothetical protein